MQVRRSLRDYSTADLIMEVIARLTPKPALAAEQPSTQPKEPEKEVLSQRQFCALVGIDRPLCAKLREYGYIPYIGTKPIKIPVSLGREGLKQYFIDANAGQIGANAKYKQTNADLNKPE